MHDDNFQPKPIFLDESRKRWNLFSAFRNFLTILCALGAIAFVISVILNPSLKFIPISKAPSPFQATAVSKKTLAKGQTDVRIKQAKFVLGRNNAFQEARTRLQAAIGREQAPQQIPLAAIAPGHVTGPVSAVFYVNYEKASLDSLAHHIDQATHLLPVWLLLGQGGKSITISRDVSKPNADNAPVVQKNDDRAIQLARAHGVAIVPVFQNADIDGDFHPEWVHVLVSNRAVRAHVIAQALAFVSKNGYQGINIDLETDYPEDRPGLTAFMAELASAFHPKGLLVTQDIQLDSDTYDLPTLSKLNDFLIPMIYDEHGTGTKAGPIASQSWFQEKLHEFLGKVPANKTVVGIANYGYDWTKDSSEPDDVNFESACQLAQESQDAPDGIIKIDKKSGNPYFTYDDDSLGQGAKEIPHTVWLEDATTAYNELLDTAPYHPLGAALWRLGTEDPSLWQFFNREGMSALSHLNPKNLETVEYNYFGTSLEGQGDVLDVVQGRTTGHRDITTDKKTGMITGETFDKYPSQVVIRCRGLVDQVHGLNTAKAIALTFDDGPDPRWTPQILKILDQYHVPATFFVVGENAAQHPGLLTKEWNMGMEIGNHSYTHPEMDSIPPVRIKLELDATQRIIEAMTGHATMLFRAPNRADSEPTTEEDYAPIHDAQKLGYLFIGEKIDPTDWLPGRKSAAIVKYVLDHANDGNCVLLHDAGGDTRAETIKALPLIIQELKKKGYHFVPVSALTGRTHDQLFPAISGSQRLAVSLDRTFFYTTYIIGTVLAVLFIITIFLGIVRILSMGILALMQAKAEGRRTFDPSFKPEVSVVIAAFNEAKVINKTIATILASDYPGLDVVVIDDGSVDNTAEKVQEVYSEDPRVTVIRKENGGKASALNLGIKKCRGEIIVALDADTVFAHDTVSKLVRHFADPAIGAVSGNVKVGNRKNPLTIWQTIEYITSQNFDRRAFDVLNCVTVVPGAVGAWRRDAMVLAGMYSSQTLAEDTDLTFKIRKLGYRIVTDNQALAYTEAPDSRRDFLKQRFRWAYGTLQCLWKHRDALFNPRYGTFGTVAMPSLWVYQIGFQAIAPIADLAIVWTFLSGWLISPNTQHGDLLMLLGYWAVFSTFELAGAWLAFHLDHEDKRLLPWLLLQKFVYRQLMYWVVLRSLIYAIQGSRVGWGKLERKGTVSQPGSPDSNSGTIDPAGIPPLLPR